MLLSALYIMWPIQIQHLQLLRLTVKEGNIYKKIHYLTFDIDLGVKVTRNVAQYPLHYVTYSAAESQVATSNGLGGDTFTKRDGRWDAITVGLLGTYSVRKIATQQIPRTFYELN